jgi:sulfur-oxidizing protein SoxZ
MHHISEFRVLVNGIEKMEGEWGTGISKNPYLSFKYLGKKGDQIQIELLDNLKQESSVETIVK